MRYSRGTVAAVALGVLAGCGSQSDGRNASGNMQAPADQAESGSAVPLPLLEGYPTAIADSINARDEALRQAADRAAGGNKGLSSVIRARNFRWNPGRIVRVAFRGGSPALHAQIERIAQQWTAPGLANLSLSFRDANGAYRIWSPQDTQYAGEIRVGFVGGREGGLWSLVGVDSIDRNVPGGRANQQSMNFEGYDQALPAGWEGTVLHEFGHALGFEHEHQSPIAACGFRFDDDPGYVPTRDKFRQFKTDSQDRRPGLYTLLSGPPNGWDRPRVDANLRQIAPSSAYDVGPFDRQSIMKYFFDGFMFAEGTSSPCYLPREADDLSGQDRVAVAAAYPRTGEEAAAIASASRALKRAAPASGELQESLEIRSEYRARLARK